MMLDIAAMPCCREHVTLAKALIVAVRSATLRPLYNNACKVVSPGTNVVVRYVPTRFSSVYTALCRLLLNRDRLKFMLDEVAKKQVKMRATKKRRAARAAATASEGVAADEAKAKRARALQYVGASGSCVYECEHESGRATACG